MGRPDLAAALSAVDDYNSIVLRRIVPELVGYIEQLEAQRAAVLSIHFNDHGECSSCTKTIGGMARVVAWPCPTVIAIGGGSHG